MLPLPTPPDPLPNTGSQLDRAVVAWLLANAAGTPSDVLPANSVALKHYPCTIVKSYRSAQAPELTGDDYWNCDVQIKGSASNEANEPNPNYKWVDLDARVGLTKAVLLQGYAATPDQAADQANLTYTAQQITAWGSDLVNPADQSPQAKIIAQNNADMAAFTCLSWYYKGQSRGEPNEEGCSWVEILHFEARVAGAVIP